MKNVADCPVTGCTNIRKREHLMCWPHWKRVPRILQSAVWDTFREMSAGRHGAEGIEAVKRYRAAAHAATAEVCKKEGRDVPPEI
jgi:hypothetical protein